MLPIEYVELLGSALGRSAACNGQNRALPIRRKFADFSFFLKIGAYFIILMHLRFVAKWKNLLSKSERHVLERYRS